MSYFCTYSRFCHISLSGMFQSFLPHSIDIPYSIVSPPTQYKPARPGPTRSVPTRFDRPGSTRSVPTRHPARPTRLDRVRHGYTQQWTPASPTRLFPSFSSLRLTCRPRTDYRCILYFNRYCSMPASRYLLLHCCCSSCSSCPNYTNTSTRNPT